nr:hypothetical protein [Mesorhizobium sp.]
MVDIVLQRVGEATPEIGIHAKIGNLRAVLGDRSARDNLLVRGNLAVTEAGGIVLARSERGCGQGAKHHDHRQPQQPAVRKQGNERACKRSAA